MLNIAIDGPSGAGKSTVAKAVAKDLNIIYLDTGAMYRATAYNALSNGIDVTDEKSVGEMLDGMKMDIRYEDGVQKIYVNGKDTTPYLREHYMSKAASDISALPCVRYKMVDIQREFAKTHDVVLDGRDIGTYVLPSANCKFFMTATPEERAKRRYKELIDRGQNVSYDQILNDIKQRDYNDSHREVAPLKQAADADFVDTTEMSIDDVVAHVKEVVHIKCKNESEGKNTEEKPISERQRKRLKKYYKVRTNFAVYRFIRLLAKPFVAICMRGIKVVNLENAMIDGRAIYTCNHYSKKDTFLPIQKIFKKEAHILAKYELFKVPLIAWFLHNMGAIPVRRAKADIDAVKSVLTVLKNDKKLLIFPEGTRNKENTQELAEVKTGTARFAIKTKSPIVPMMYYSCPKVFRKNCLYIGKPFTLEEFYGAKTQEEMHAATEVVRQKMDETRALCNEYFENNIKKKPKGRKSR